MPLPVITDVCRITLSGLVEGGVGWSNTIHVARTSTGSWSTSIPLIDAEISKLYSQAGYGAGKYGWAQYNTDGTTFKQATYTPLDGATASTTINHSGTGVSTQAALPAQNAMVITLKTGTRGRSYRGRVFWTCNSREVMNGDGTIAQADLDGTVLAWQAFNTALGALATPCGLVVASYKNATSNAVTGYQPRAVMGHQTHRRGRGA